MHLAAGFEPEFAPQVFGNQNLPLEGDLGYGHKFFSQWKKSVRRAESVGKLNHENSPACVGWGSSGLERKRRAALSGLSGRISRLLPPLSSGYDSQSMAQTFFKVLAPQEALRILLAVEPLDTERIQSVKGRGRVLAEDLYSVVDLPHFNRAAMDGYAVKAKDTFGASQSLPAYLRLAGVVEMGKAALQPLAAGEAIRISTGGMMPAQSDAVVMVEYTDETAAGLVEIHRGVSPWQNVIQIGDDIKK